MSSEMGKTPAKAWVVTLAGLGINLALGVLYTWSVLTATLTTKLKVAGGVPVPSAEAGKFINITATGAEKPISVAKAVLAQGAFNWTPINALMPYALALLCFAFTMAIAGRIQDRIGPRVVASVGGVFVGLGMIVASFNNMAASASHLPIILGFGVLTGAGIGMAYACATPAAIKWFHPSRKGLITGLVVAGFGLASVYTAPLTKALIASGGPQAMFRTLGIAFFFSIIILAQLLQNPPEGYTAVVPAKFAAAAKASPANATMADVKCDYTWQEMVRKPQFYLLWLMYAFAAFAGLMMVGIIAKVAPEQLGDPEFALKWGYTLTVALAIGNGLGRPAAGMLSDSIGRTRSMIIVFLAQAVLVGWVLGISHTLTVLLVVAAGIGAMYGANLTLFPATTADFFGTKNLGVNYGLVFTAWGVGGAAGSYFSGFAKQIFGSFTPAYTVAAVLLVVASGMTLLTKAPRPEPACATPKASEVGEPA